MRERIKKGQWRKESSSPKVSPDSVGNITEAMMKTRSKNSCRDASVFL